MPFPNVVADLADLAHLAGNRYKDVAAIIPGRCYESNPVIEKHERITSRKNLDIRSICSQFTSTRVKACGVLQMALPVLELTSISGSGEGKKTGGNGKFK